MDRLILLRELSKSWPPSLEISPRKDGIPDLTGHPLQGELMALLNGEPTTLPYFSSAGPWWLTMAASPEQLQEALAKLRCWIIPSFGWEAEARPLITDPASSGSLGKLVLTLYPAGYLRWRSTSGHADTIISRLARMRELDEAKPVHVFERIPTLFEVRQRFQGALLTGDREAAEEAIRLADHHQLDSAVNTLFMRIHLWDTFREFKEITSCRELDELLRLRLPKGILLALVRAFHMVYLDKYEQAEDLDAAFTAYSTYVHEALGDQIRDLHSKDMPELARCLAYLAKLKRDVGLARSILEGFDDPLAEKILESVALGESGEAVKPTVERESDEPDIVAAISSVPQDWTLLQEQGLALVRGRWQGIAPELAENFKKVLQLTLEQVPNQELAELLGRAVDSARPSCWRGVAVALRSGDYQGAKSFIQMEERPNLLREEAEVIEDVSSVLEELATDPEEGNLCKREATESFIGAFLEDFVRDPEYPETRFTAIYSLLFRLWAERRSMSAQPQDGQILLTLASALLMLDVRYNLEVARTVSEWWARRCIRTRIPFALEGLELLSGYAPDLDEVSNLWMSVADFLRRSGGECTQGERILMRRLGTLAGFDKTSVEEYLGTRQDEEDEPDIMAGAGIRRIAIVSLQEKTAQAAAEIIRSRTGAEVILVTEKKAGAQARLAGTADVILFVWGASKHAVYRAFDGLRDKLAYVQGVSASSIVLALEMWVTRKLIP